MIIYWIEYILCVPHGKKATKENKITKPGCSYVHLGLLVFVTGF